MSRERDQNESLSCNSGMAGDQIWCVVTDHVAMHIPQVMDGVLFVCCTYAPVLCILGTAGRIALNLAMLLQTIEV